MADHIFFLFSWLDVWCRPTNVPFAIIPVCQSFTFSNCSPRVTHIPSDSQTVLPYWYQLYCFMVMTLFILFVFRCRDVPVPWPSQLRIHYACRSGPVEKCIGYGIESSECCAILFDNELTKITITVVSTLSSKSASEITCNLHCRISAYNRCETRNRIQGIIAWSWEI